jgi:hypothetical protein
VEDEPPVTRHDTNTPLSVRIALGLALALGCNLDGILPDGDDDGGDGEDTGDDDDGGDDGDGDGSATRGETRTDGGDDGEAGDDGEEGDDGETGDDGDGGSSGLPPGDGGDDDGTSPDTGSEGEYVCGGWLDPTLDDPCEQCLIADCCDPFTACGEDANCTDCLLWIIQDPQGASDECYEAAFEPLDCMLGPCGSACG